MKREGAVPRCENPRPSDAAISKQVDVRMLNAIMIQQGNATLKSVKCLDLTPFLAPFLAQTPHTALKNVSPLDVYMGRKEEILRKRAEKKALTMERRRLYNKALREYGRQL